MCVPYQILGPWGTLRMKVSIRTRSLRLVRSARLINTSVGPPNTAKKANVTNHKRFCSYASQTFCGLRTVCELRHICVFCCCSQAKITTRFSCCAPSLSAHSHSRRATCDINRYSMLHSRDAGPEIGFPGRTSAGNSLGETSKSAL